MGLKHLDDLVVWHIGKGAVIRHILHMPTSVHIVRMKNGVVFSVEIQGLDVKAFTEGAVEGRGDLEPAAVEHKFRIAVIDEQVGLHDLPQTLRREVITDVGEAQAAGDACRPSCGGKDDGFGDAVAVTLADDHTGPEGFRGKVDPVGIVLNFVADGIV